MFTQGPGLWGGTVDPLFSKVVLLLHMDGANNGTSFVDSGPLGLTVNRVGTGAITSTVQSKFGGSSLATQSTGGLSIPSNAAMNPGTQDFCIEFWFYATDVANTATIFERSMVANRLNGSQLSCKIAATANTDTRYGTAINNEISLSTGPGAYSVNTWNHLAIVKLSGTLYVYLNGTLKSSTTAASPPLDSTQPFFIGANSTPDFYFNGFIDEFRYTVGAARYTSNFAVPTAAFPNS